jgi:hypothetical protein
VDFCVEIKYGAQKKDRMRGTFWEKLRNAGEGA